MGGGNTQTNTSNANSSSFDTGTLNTNAFDSSKFQTAIGNDIMAEYLKGSNVFDKSMYAGLSDMTTTGLDALTSAANGFGTGLQDASNYATSVINNTDPSLTEQTLLATAQGANLGENDPYFEQLLKTTLDNTGTSVNSTFSNSGRFGAGSHVNSLATGLGTVEAQARSTQYQQALDRQSAALAAIEAARNNTAAQKMTAANSMGQLYQNTLLPGQTLLGVGQTLDADAQAKLVAERDLFDRQNSANSQKIAETLGLLGVTNAEEVEQPWGLGDWLSFGAKTATAFL